MTGLGSKVSTAVLVMALAAAGAVRAQGPEASVAPRPLVGSAAQPPAPIAPEQPMTAGGEIVVAPLGRAEAPAGTLEAANGGLGFGIWQGTPRAEAEAMLDRLPISTAIPLIRNLARRLLLTRAAAPAGDAAHAFVTVRLRRLLDGGLLADAGDLARQASVPDDAGFDRARADALLYAGDSADLCGPDTARRTDSAEAFWVRLRAYCYAAAGDEAALGLTRAVMQAQGFDDPGFDTLLANLHAKKPKLPDDFTVPDAIDAFLLRQQGLPVPVDVAETLGTPGLVLAALSAGNDPGERLQAAERVFRTGALAPADLAAIADAQSFTADQFATFYGQVQRMPFLQGQALLRQAIRRAPPDVQPALLDLALASAETKTLLGVAARLEHDPLLQLAPSGADRDLSALIARALMLSGEPARAAMWASMLNPALPSDAPLRARLDVALHLMAPDTNSAMDLSGAYGELAHEITQATPDAAFATLALNAALVLHEPVPPRAEQIAIQSMETAWPGRRIPQPQLHRLAQALQSPGTRGAALSLILIGLGPQGPADMAPDAIVRLIRDLIREGQAPVARELAVEALLTFQRQAPPPLPISPPAGSATL